MLDVTDTGAVARLAAEFDERHGGVDIVVSNAVARLSPDQPQSEQADEFIDVANGGTHAILRSFAPVLRPGGRLIVVASSLGTLGHLNARLHPLFDSVSLEEVEEAVESWRGAIHAGTAEERGWPRWLNVPSKVAQVAAVRAVAAQGERRARGHPGRGGLSRARGHPAVAAVVRRLQPGADAGAGRARPSVLRSGRPGYLLANSSTSVRCCPGTTEHLPDTRTDCSPHSSSPIQEFSP